MSTNPKKLREDGFQDERIMCTTARAGLSRTAVDETREGGREDDTGLFGFREKTDTICLIFLIGSLQLPC